GSPDIASGARPERLVCRVASCSHPLAVLLYSACLNNTFTTSARVVQWSGTIWASSSRAMATGSLMCRDFVEGSDANSVFCRAGQPETATTSEGLGANLAPGSFR